MNLASSPLAAAPVCGAPSAEIDGAHIAAKDDASVDIDALCAAVRRIATPEANLHGVVVERGGRLQLEAYFDGTDNPGGSLFSRAASFGPDDLHDVRSVTKSVMALLLGIAVDRGLVEGVDAPVLDYFPEHRDLAGTPKSRITLAHLLAMSSGLAWDESGGYVRPGNDETRMRFSSDPDRYVLDRELTDEPGARFNYNGGGTALLGEVVVRTSKMPLEAFAKEALFDPLGIGVTEWRRDRNGRVTPFGGLRLRPRDMVKLGRLVLNRGQWNGRQIVSAAWIEQMTHDRLPAGALRYGWQWWLGEIAFDGRRHRYLAAFGNGGQRVFIVDELDLVVVVTAGQYNKDTSWQAPLRVLRDVVASVR
ncbi:MAG: serine hydrolase [Rhizobiales bacterium]|nr:serine hydrolase [Rhizobacter sp.]